MLVAGAATLDAQLAALRPEFERDGAVCVRAAFSTEWLDLLAAGIAENMAHPGPMAKDTRRPASPAGSSAIIATGAAFPSTMISCCIPRQQKLPAR